MPNKLKLCLDRGEIPVIQNREELPRYEYRFLAVDQDDFQSFKGLMTKIKSVLPFVEPNKHRMMWKHEDVFVTFTTTDELDIALNMNKSKGIFTVWIEAKVFRGKPKRNNKFINRRRVKRSPSYEEVEGKEEKTS